MSLPPIYLYAGGRTRARVRTPPPIPNARGEDIRSPLEAAAEAASIPTALLLACIMAESDLDPRAERWGHRTAEARAAIAAGDRAALQRIVDEAWPDISFGYGQRIVAFHYAGDRSRTVGNALLVRQHVFDHPDEDLVQAARFLAPRLSQARQADLTPCDRDELLGALVAYNCGHFPARDEPYWRERQSAIARYRDALARGRALLSD